MAIIVRSTPPHRPMDDFIVAQVAAHAALCWVLEIPNAQDSFANILSLNACIIAPDRN